MLLTVHEHEVIWRGEGRDPLSLPASLFDPLKQFCVQQGSEGTSPLTPAYLQGREALRVGNLVGVIETPQGLTVEILPKLDLSQTGDVQAEREVLLEMLLTAGVLPAVKTPLPTGVRTAKVPFQEVFFQLYLQEVAEVVRRGLTKAYTEQEEQLLALRGRLDLPRQLRENQVLRHRFAVRHQTYTLNRPENRLIRSALQRVRVQSRDPENQRHVQALLFAFEEVPFAGPLEAEFRQWTSDRNSIHYQALQPLTGMLLRGQAPFATLGDTRFFSLLFPMQDVYEQYVVEVLRRSLPGWRVEAQHASRFLALHQGRGMFQMRPDVLLSGGEQKYILDTKWKRLDGRDRLGHYGMAQQDMYQMLAYARGHLQGQRPARVLLLYPQNLHFQQRIGPFELGDGIEVWAVPVFAGSRQPLEHVLELLAL